ncbi:MAG: phosphate signaling complex protein PhoU [Defluviitaleaceae bacterium]|nr:phosphate signaling complex protein PhoU [Defluviitaleaceae bacterium]
MMRRFDQQLDELNNKLKEMGALVEKSIILASEALIHQDVALAKNVIIFEADVEEKEKDIEALCLKLLMQQQPVAKDLRVISAALKMITDMERIGDQAADISEIVVMMNGAPYVQELIHIPQMAIATVKMVTDSIEAYVKKDLKLAKSIIAYDDVVDDLFDKVKFDLIELIRSDNPNSEQAIDLLMVAKFFERIGDHACNIASWVVYSITGKQAKIN